MKPGDMVMSSFGNSGTITSIDDSHGMFWVEVWWSNGKFTWEDMLCSMECGSIWLVK